MDNPFQIPSSPCTDERVVDSIEEHVLDLEYRAEVLKEVFFDKVSKTRLTVKCKSV